MALRSARILPHVTPPRRLLPSLGLVASLLGCHAAAPIARTPPVPATPAPPTPPAPPVLRLPAGVEPLGYQVELSLDPDATAAEGLIDIRLRISAPTEVLWLNGTDLTVLEAELRPPAAPPQALRVVPGGEQFIGFVAPQRLTPGEATLRVRYRAPISDRDSAGLFRQRDGQDWYAFSDFEPIDARRAFPCFDEPSYKVPWQLSLRVPPRYSAYTNSPQIGESPTGTGHKLVRFAPTPPLPSYLVSLAVGPFEAVDAGTAGRNKTPIRVITPRGRSAEARYATEITGPIVDRLEDYFGSPYPFDKLDLIAVPQQGGAMENPGLITFRQSLLLAAPAEQTLRFQRGLALTAAHELAHQWFGDLVTMAFWDDLWLNESFASWTEAKIIAGLRPTWGVRKAVVSSRNGAMNADGLLSARRIRQPIKSEDDIANAFDAITYNKGQAVLDMFERHLGEDTFRRGVRRYLATHARKNATAADFLRALSEEAGADVAGPLGTFLDQPGVPLVRVAIDCQHKVPLVHLTQQRYLPLGSAAGEGERAQRWQIPVCLKYPAKNAAGSASECRLMKAAAETVTLSEAGACPGFVIANAAPPGGAAGYYRVAYAPDVLRRLLTTPEGQRALSPEDRLAIVADLSALVRLGDLPAGDALALVPALMKTPDRHTVGLVGNLLGLIEPLVPTAQRPAYLAFLRALAGPTARALGFQPQGKKNEDEDTRLLRPALVSLAVAGEDPRFLAEARRLAGAWLTDRGAVDTETLDLVLTAAARRGDLALFQRLREAAAREPERRTRRRLYGAMGAFLDPAAAAAARQLLLSEDIDLRDAMGLIGGQLEPRETREAAYAFLKEHREALLRRLPRDSASMMARMAAGSFCSVEHGQDLEATFGPAAARATGGPRVLAQTLERLRLCDTLRKAQEQSLVAFLQKQR